MNDNPFGFPPMKWSDVDLSYEYALDEILVLQSKIQAVIDLHVKNPKYLDTTPVCNHCREDFPCTTLKILESN